MVASAAIVVVGAHVRAHLAIDRARRTPTADLGALGVLVVARLPHGTDHAACTAVERVEQAALATVVDEAVTIFAITCGGAALHRAGALVAHEALAPRALRWAGHPAPSAVSRLGEDVGVAREARVRTRHPPRRALGRRTVGDEPRFCVRIARVDWSKRRERSSLGHAGGSDEASVGA